MEDFTPRTTAAAALSMLWVEEIGGGWGEPWARHFAGVCAIERVSAGQLARVGRDDWDCVCFDFGYPDSSALRLIPDTKRRWPSAPVVLLTLQSSAELALWALRARVFDMLVKPFSAHEVDNCIQRLREAVQARRSQTTRQPRSVPRQIPAELCYRPQAAPTVRLQIALAHISKHFARQLPESEVAAACEMSPSRFSREFKAAFGVTFVDYLSNHRVAEAKRLLVNPRMSVTDIAAAVGLGDPSYFARVFRKVVGISPSEYRASGCCPVRENVASA